MDAATTFLGKVETAVINPLVTLIVLAAFVVFVWGVVEFIRNADEPEARKTGQMHMIWGIVGLVIIFGTNAIIAIIKATLGSS